VPGRSLCPTDLNGDATIKDRKSVEDSLVLQNFRSRIDEPEQSRTAL